MDIVDTLRGAARGLCTENPDHYIPRGVSAGTCIRAAAEIERLRAENRFLFDVIKDDALLVERYNAFNERRLNEQET